MPADVVRAYALDRVDDFNVVLAATRALVEVTGLDTVPGEPAAAS